MKHTHRALSVTVELAGWFYEVESPQERMPLGALLAFDRADPYGVALQIKCSGRHVRFVTAYEDEG